jgi:hypothetical protein
MNSKARIPAKTIKKMCQPWRLAMMKTRDGLKNQGFQSVSHANEMAATSKICGMSDTMHAKRSCATAATKWCSTWHFKLPSACLPACLFQYWLSRAHGKKMKKQLLYRQVPM